MRYNILMWILVLEQSKKEECETWLTLADPSNFQLFLVDSKDGAKTLMAFQQRDQALEKQTKAPFNIEVSKVIVLVYNSCIS